MPLPCHIPICSWRCPQTSTPAPRLGGDTHAYTHTHTHSHAHIHRHSGTRASTPTHTAAHKYPTHAHTHTHKHLKENGILKKCKCLLSKQGSSPKILARAPGGPPTRVIEPSCLVTSALSIRFLPESISLEELVTPQASGERGSSAPVPSLEVSKERIPPHRGGWAQPLPSLCPLPFSGCQTTPQCPQVPCSQHHIIGKAESGRTRPGNFGKETAGPGAGYRKATARAVEENL